MTMAGQWGQGPARARAARSAAPTGPGAGNNARGSVSNYQTLSGPQNAPTAGAGGTGTVKYGGTQPKAQAKAPAPPPFIDAHYQLSMAQRAGSLEKQKYQTEYDLAKMKSNFAGEQAGMQDSREQSFDQMYQQLGGAGFARSGARAMGGSQMQNQYQRSLYELQQRLGNPAQNLQRKLLEMSQKEYDISKMAELGIAREREIARKGTEVPVFSPSEGLDFTKIKKGT